MAAISQMKLIKLKGILQMQTDLIECDGSIDSETAQQMTLFVGYVAATLLRVHPQMSDKDFGKMAMDVIEGMCEKITSKNDYDTVIKTIQEIERQGSNPRNGAAASGVSGNGMGASLQPRPFEEFQPPKQMLAQVPLLQLEHVGAPPQSLSQSMRLPPQGEVKQKLNKSQSLMNSSFMSIKLPPQGRVLPSNNQRGLYQSQYPPNRERSLLYDQFASTNQINQQQVPQSSRNINSGSMWSTQKLPTTNDMDSSEQPSRESWKITKPVEPRQEPQGPSIGGWDHVVQNMNVIKREDPNKPKNPPQEKAPNSMPEAVVVEDPFSKLTAFLKESGLEDTKQALEMIEKLIGKERLAQIATQPDQFPYLPLSVVKMKMAKNNQMPHDQQVKVVVMPQDEEQKVEKPEERKVDQKLDPMSAAIQEEEESCEICYELYTQEYFALPLTSCQHKFHLECLQDYAVQDLGKQNTKCPKVDCTVLISYSDMQNFLEPDKFEIYKKAQINPWIVANQAELTQCVKEDCNNAFIKGERQITNVCSACQTKACLVCNVPYHVDKTCEQFMEELHKNGLLAKEKENDQLFAAKMKETGNKQCKCGVWVERSEACHHIKCSQCNYEFCYLCGAEYKTCDCLGPPELVYLPHGETVEEALQSKYWKEWATRVGAKMCPEEGCDSYAKMQKDGRKTDCEACMHTFCFDCLAEWGTCSCN